MFCELIMSCLRFNSTISLFPFVSQLPKKLDKIVFCELTPLQLRAYQ